MNPAAVVDDKPVAYVEVMGDDRTWGVAICKEGEDGYHPVPDYSGYDSEERAKGIAERLNKRLGVDSDEALRIVLSTMRKYRRKTLRRMVRR